MPVLGSAWVSFHMFRSVVNACLNTWTCIRTWTCNECIGAMVMMQLGNWRWVMHYNMNMYICMMMNMMNLFNMVWICDILDNMMNMCWLMPWVSMLYVMIWSDDACYPMWYEMLWYAYVIHKWMLGYTYDEMNVRMCTRWDYEMPCWCWDEWLGSMRGDVIYYA